MPTDRQRATVAEIPTDALKALAAERVAADAAALYRTQEARMSKHANQQRRAAARDGRNDAKWWKAQAKQEAAKGNHDTAQSHRQHAARRLSEARRVDPDR